MEQDAIEEFLSKATLRQIEVMVAVQKYGSMSKAAEMLGMSVAGVSRISKRFEDNLGTPLFFGDKRRSVLHDNGNYLIDCLKPVISEIEVLRNRLGDLPD